MTRFCYKTQSFRSCTGSRTKIELAIDLVEAAIRHKLPFSVVLFDSWYLAESFVAVLRHRHKDWISILKKNRNLETNSFVLKDADGKPISLDGPHISVENLVPLIPATAYRAVTVGDKTYWTFTLAVRIPGLGKVRLVISFDAKRAELAGTYAVLVTNRVDWTAQRIIATSLQRWPIETFFSDQKSRGFNLHKSHIADPKRLARLMIAACLAYIWIIHLGVVAKRDGWVSIIHCTDRCDLSFFQLGLNLLDHVLNECLPIPVAFHIPRLAKSVR